MTLWFAVCAAVQSSEGGSASALSLHSVAPTFSHVHAIALPFSEVSHVLVRTSQGEKRAGGGGAGIIQWWLGGVHHGRNLFLSSSGRQKDAKCSCCYLVNTPGQKS